MVRILAALIAAAVALCAWLWIGTGGAEHPGGEGPAPAADFSAAQAGAQSLAGAEAARAAEAPAHPIGGADAEAARLPLFVDAPRIAGSVRHADGTPGVHALVGLFRPAAESDGDASAFAPAEAANSDDASRLRIVRSWTRADEEGRFHFEVSEPGTWVLRADRGPLLCAATPPFVLLEGVSRTDLLVELPAAAWVGGRILAPEGADFDAVWVELRANGEAVSPWHPDTLLGGAVLRCRADAEGRYRLGPARPGFHTLAIALDAGATSRERTRPVAGNSIPAGDLYLPPGETGHDLDLRAGFPGSIRVVFRCMLPPGLSEQRVRARVEPLDEQRVVESRSVDGVLGEPIEIAPLLPGSWDVSVLLPRIGPWRMRPPAPVHVFAAARTEVVIDAEFARATLELLDAREDGPLQAGVVEVGSLAGLELQWTQQVRVGTGGRLELLLPLGSYAVTALEEGLDRDTADRSGWSSFEWTSAGPVPRRLRVAR